MEAKVSVELEQAQTTTPLSSLVQETPDFTETVSILHRRLPLCNRRHLLQDRSQGPQAIAYESCKL